MKAVNERISEWSHLEKPADWVLVFPNCPNVPNTLKHVKLDF